MAVRGHLGTRQECVGQVIGGAAERTSCRDCRGRRASTLCYMTDALIRRAEHADLAAIVQLRREWTQEEHGDIADSDFDEHLAAWFARESSRRIMWPAEEGGRPGGTI